VDQLGDDLGVGVGLEHVALALRQKFIQMLIKAFYSFDYGAQPTIS
jgi:hypothetical protein